MMHPFLTAGQADKLIVLIIIVYLRSSFDHGLHSYLD